MIKKEYISSKIAENYKSVTKTLDILAQGVVEYLCNHKKTVSVAESCTGGMLGASLTSIPGVSEVFEMGIISYTNRIKVQHLQVPAEVIDEFTAISSQTAICMAKGIMEKSGSDFGVGITGLAGPQTATDTAPVGTVYVAICSRYRHIVENLTLNEKLENPDREDIRINSVAAALRMLLKFAEEEEERYNGNI